MVSLFLNENYRYVSAENDKNRKVYDTTATTVFGVYFEQPDRTQESHIDVDPFENLSKWKKKNL